MLSNAAFPGFPWFNASLPISARSSALVANLTLTEKISLLTDTWPALPTQAIPAYSFYSEGGHGLALAGRATVFPSPLGMAASFDRAVARDIGYITAIEARANYNNVSRSTRR